MTATELENLRDSNEMSFHRELEQWAAGDHFLTKDNAEELGQLMIDMKRCFCGDDLKDGDFRECAACRKVHLPQPKAISEPYAQPTLMPMMTLLKAVGVVLGLWVFLWAVL